MTTPLCSVVIPVYNGGAYIKAAIESCLAQKYRQVELVLVDDHSSDQSREILGEYSRRYPESTRVIRHPENRGLNQSIISGVSQAKGEYIAILGQDDIMFPERISIEMELIQRHAVSMVCTNACFMIDEQKTEKLVRPSWTSNGHVLREAFLFTNPVIGPTVLFRKNDFQKIGADTFAFRNSMEWLHWLHYANMRGIYYTAEPLIYYRRHAHNLSSTLYKTAEFKRYRKFCREFAWSHCSPLEIARGLAYHQLGQQPVKIDKWPPA